ncbi:site-specific integrase [Micromonospora sp. URMC 103]|uniref:site-specific integrase n=1 Tax=Micromonospora sp. URMC 103 TaxID=3423406 RepID=UPI003F1BE088
MAAFPASAPSLVPTDQLVLRAAVSASLGRYRGQTRVHTDSDLRVFLRWCTDQVLDPLAAARVDTERYVRWLQDVRRYQASTVSRRLSVVLGFYRVCVIDAILEHSPADYVRRRTVPAESPTLGLGHLQFEALITTARLSSNPNDFALGPARRHPPAQAPGPGRRDPDAEDASPHAASHVRDDDA